MVGDKRAGMVVVWTKLSKVQGWQVDGLMLRGERMFQGSREGQRWTWSKLKLSMGIIFFPACKVLVKMAARKLLWNFGMIFGGL